MALGIFKQDANIPTTEGGLETPKDLGTQEPTQSDAKGGLPTLDVRSVAKLRPEIVLARFSFTKGSMKLYHGLGFRVAIRYILGGGSQSVQISYSLNSFNSRWVC